MFYRVSPRHKVAIVKVRLARTLCSFVFIYSVFFSLDHVPSMNNYFRSVNMTCTNPS